MTRDDDPNCRYGECRMSVKLAILAPDHDGSPKVLAQGLQHMLSKLGVPYLTYWGIDGLLRRLLPLREKPRRWYLYSHRRLQEKLSYYSRDRRFLKEVGTCSAAILCHAIPNALWRNYYDIESLCKCLPGVPILLYAVQYLGNVPTMQRRLAEEGNFGIERYDWHLSVSDVTELRGKPSPPWSAIGLDLEHTELQAVPRSEFVVVIDFAQPGFERYRREQLLALQDLGITPLVLEGRYRMTEIRRIYQMASVFFIQSFESFGVPIAECLYSGAYIFTPHSGWPMAFRLDAEPQIAGQGTLPDIFRVYRDAEDLRQQLIALRKSYDPVQDPIRISEKFRKTYPTFCFGNLDALRDVVKQIEMGEFAGRSPHWRDWLTNLWRVYSF